MIKRICENIGVDSKSQLEKINSDPVLSKARVLITLPTEGGPQTVICLPLKYMYGWLMKLNPSKVAPHIMDKLIQYQELVYDAIYNYFHPKSNSTELTPSLMSILNNIASILPAYANQINMLDISYRKIAIQQDEMVEEIKEAFRIAKDQTIKELKDSLVKANVFSATPNGKLVTIAELKRDPALGPVIARFVNNRSTQSLAQSLVFWTEHNGQRVSKSGSANLYPYDLVITFFDESINPYIKKYI